MLWKKKEPKQKPQKKVAPPKHIAENVKAGEDIAKGFDDGLTQEPKKKARRKSSENRS